MSDLAFVAIGVAAAFLFGAVAVYLAVWKTPNSERLADFLVVAAGRLLDAAVTALTKAMDKQERLAGERSTVLNYDPKLDRVISARETLRGYHEK